MPNGDTISRREFGLGCPFHRLGIPGIMRLLAFTPSKRTAKSKIRKEQERGQRPLRCPTGTALAAAIVAKDHGNTPVTLSV